MGLTYERMSEVLRYERSSGDLYWKQNVGRGRTGDKAGSIVGQYRRIKIDGRRYLAQNLVWFFEHKRYPTFMLDHIDRIKINNHIKNLRKSNKILNGRNMGMHPQNTSGVKGVSKHTQTGRWQAMITVNQKSFGLGLYADFDDAVCARFAAEQCLNWGKSDALSSAHEYVLKHIIRG